MKLLHTLCVCECRCWSYGG